MNRFQLVSVFARIRKMISMHVKKQMYMLSSPYNQEIYGKTDLPGIPQTFLKLFFTASNNTEDLMAELDQNLVNIESVNRILEIATNDMEA